MKDTITTTNSIIMTNNYCLLLLKSTKCSDLINKMRYVKLPRNDDDCYEVYRRLSLCVTKKKYPHNHT